MISAPKVISRGIFVTHVATACLLFRRLLCIVFGAEDEKPSSALSATFSLSSHLRVGSSPASPASTTDTLLRLLFGRRPQAVALRRAARLRLGLCFGLQWPLGGNVVPGSTDTEALPEPQHLLSVEREHACVFCAMRLRTNEGRRGRL